MIEITKFFESKINWINFIVLIFREKNLKKKSISNFTFPLGKPSSFKISNIRFSVLPEANVLLILNTNSSFCNYFSYENSYLRTGIFLLTFNINDNFIQLNKTYNSSNYFHWNSYCFRNIVVGQMLFALWLCVIFLRPSIHA
jgi:hypothetical protein